MEGGIGLDGSDLNTACVTLRRTNQTGPSFETLLSGYFSSFIPTGMHHGVHQVDLHMDGVLLYMEQDFSVGVTPDTI